MSMQEEQAPILELGLGIYTKKPPREQWFVIIAWHTRETRAAAGGALVFSNY